ncbi:MAG: cupin domain-containing protein [Acidobacteria bacterium]|nr:cupin domain-containing protein [Acidobacteriota bacterium]
MIGMPDIDLTKDRIRAAQIVLPCADINNELLFFVERLGFRVEMISPADAPSVAVVSGYGLNLRLETSGEKLPLVLRLGGDFSSLPFVAPREIVSPDGVRVQFFDAESLVEIPDGTQEFIVTTASGENAWSAGRAGMLYRDLIPGRLGDRFVASHISIPEGGEIPDYVHFHKVRFQMIYCIRGWARLVYENQGEPFLMNAGDCVLQPPEIRHRVLESSAQFEVLEIGCPAIHATHADHALTLPNDALAFDKIYGANQRFLHHVAAEAVWQDSQIKNIESRDTEIKRASDGLADVRLLQATAEASFPVNHRGEFLFYFILKGGLRLGGKAGEVYRLNANDCFVLPRDTSYLVEADEGLEMLRVNLPADNF